MLSLCNPPPARLRLIGVDIDDWCVYVLVSSLPLDTLLSTKHAAFYVLDK